MPPLILAVIVLYRIGPEDSISYRSLLRAYQALPSGALELGIILHDNSPQANPPAQLPQGVQYRHDGNNAGLANAYNDALTFALTFGYSWLMTLDQDTEMPPDALQKLLGILANIEDRHDVAAVVPEIHAGGRIVSPNTFLAGAWPRWFPAGYSGVPDDPVFAFNSGSLIRVTALRQVGGYSPWFWLDNSDAWLYRQLHAYGKRVYVAGNLPLQHEFSMQNMQARVSPARYETILLAESGFWDSERNMLARGERTLRLAVRVIKHLMRGDSPALRHLTLRALAHRLFRSRAYRLDLWKKRTTARLGSAFRYWQKPERPMISVCMAAYSGERYIESQLRSIIPQLGEGDEIVIIDDASPDNSAQRVQAIQGELADKPGAPTIHLHRHTANQGLVATFEDAIRNATGDILFLADDDDLWASDKVSKVLSAFSAQPEIQIVATNLSLIDEHGEPFFDPGLLRHRHFNTGVAANILFNQFQGSTMAFRASLIRFILPFPTGKLFLHDAWTGLRAILNHADIAFIDESLLFYRRHTGNYSRRHSRFRQLLLRLQLMSALLLRWRQTL